MGSLEAWCAVHAQPGAVTTKPGDALTRRAGGKAWTAREGGDPAPCRGRHPVRRELRIKPLLSRPVQALRQIETWPVSFAAAGAVTAEGGIETHGDAARAVRLASVSKPVAALAVLVAAEEGVVDLDEPAGPPGSTVRHLLAHASGLPFEGGEQIASPGRRRIYSNEGFRVLAAHLAHRAEMPFTEYVHAAICAPLRIALDPAGDPGSGMHASLADVLEIARELLEPTLLARETLDEMTAVQFAGLSGVLPDYGRFDPLDWGLGVQVNTRPATWMGSKASVQSFGHFGGSGTFVWVDPAARVACVALTDREFDEWAKEAWPKFSDAVLEELQPGSD
jgi:CubicO group peptidase (beta-lactamase class C family)